MRKVVFLFGMLMMAINSNAQKEIDVVVVNDLSDIEFNEWSILNGENDIFYYNSIYDENMKLYIEEFLFEMNIDSGNPDNIDEEDGVVYKTYSVLYDDESFANVVIAIDKEYNEASIIIRIE
jgi:hypothetical protein